MAERPGPYQHVFRVAGLFLFGFFVFAVVRWALVPEDFGRYGFYRAGALDDARAIPSRYAGEKTCVDCHEEPAQLRKGQGHERVTCEACHGPLARHADGDYDNDKPRALNPRLFCLPCHAELKGRPASLPQMDPKDHGVDDSCIECHKPHRPKAEIQ
jgi:hypothetical protein